MVLESTMILMDNSEYQRNGDYFPSRLLVQKDGINLVCQVKLRANPENNVGLLTCSAPCQVLCTLITDGRHFFTKLHGVNPSGNINLQTAIRIAHLALKHRNGKNHKMRIVAFVGSPLKLENNQELHGLAKRLKKEKVSVDVVSFGEHQENVPLLSEFVETLNGKNGESGSSHLLIVPRGIDLVKALMESPIIRDNESGSSNLAPDAYEFGFDPDDDPELAFALRISMEEERQRHAAPTLEETRVTAASALSTEEENLQRAMNISSQTTALNYRNFPDFNNMSEQDQIAYAMRMSMDDYDGEVTDDSKSETTTTPSTENNTDVTENLAENQNNSTSPRNKRTQGNK